MTWQSKASLIRDIIRLVLQKKRSHTWEINQMLTSALSGTMGYAIAGVTMTKLVPRASNLRLFVTMKGFSSSCWVKVSSMLIICLKYSSFRRKYYHLGFWICCNSEPFGFLDDP